MDSGNLANRIKDLGEEAMSIAVIVKAMTGSLYLHGQNTGCSKAWTDCKDTLHTAQHQAGADQQYQGQGDFSHHQRPAHQLMPGRGTG